MKTKLKGSNVKKNRVKRNASVINFSVVTGFLFLLIWIVFFYKNTFVDLKIVLALLFIPSLLLSIVFYRKIVPVTLESGLLNFISYLMVYVLITIPIGNLIVILFFSLNTFLASNRIEKVNLRTENSGLTAAKRGHFQHGKRTYYSHFDVQYNGITKTFNTGDTPIDALERKEVEFTLAEGFFGYYVIKSRKIK